MGKAGYLKRCGKILYGDRGLGRVRKWGRMLIAFVRWLEVLLLVLMCRPS